MIQRPLTAPAIMIAALAWLFAAGPVAAQTPVTSSADVAPAAAATPDSPAPQDVAAGTKPAKPWNAWDNSAFSSMLIFTIGADVGAFVQDAGNTAQMGEQPTQLKWRAERVNFGGQIHFKTPWTYQIGGNFNGLEAEQGNRWSWMDVRLDIPITRNTRIRIGRQKVGVSDEWILPLTDWVFMERSSGNNAFIPQRNVGVILTGTFANHRGLWATGWFNDWYAQRNRFLGNGNQYTARLSFLPVDSGEQGDTVVQVGAGVFYKEATNGKLQYRARPEINQSDYFVDTAKFAGDHSITSQFEFMAIKGRAQVFGEWAITPVSSPGAGNPLFYGGFAGASYFLTQERRVYNRPEGIYKRLTPGTPVGAPGGGMGAWEVGARYSYVNLTAGTIDGGKMSRLTGEISWYPTRVWRLQFNYGYITLETDGKVGHAHGLSARIAWNM